MSARAGWGASATTESTRAARLLLIQRGRRLMATPEGYVCPAAEAKAWTLDPSPSRPLSSAMPFGWREALTGAAVLFVLFLLVKMRPLPAGRRKLDALVRAARDRAHAAQSPRERALALGEAGTLAATEARRWTA